MKMLELDAPVVSFNVGLQSSSSGCTANITIIQCIVSGGGAGGGGGGGGGEGE